LIMWIDGLSPEAVTSGDNQANQHNIIPCRIIISLIIQLMAQIKRLLRVWAIASPGPGRLAVITF